MVVVVQTATDRYVFPEAESIEIDKCSMEISTVEPGWVIVEEVKE